MLLRALRRASTLIVAGVAAHHYLKRRGSAGAPPAAGPPPPRSGRSVPPVRSEPVESAPSNGNGKGPAVDVNAVVEELLSTPRAEQG